MKGSTRTHYFWGAFVTYVMQKNSKLWNLCIVSVNLSQEKQKNAFKGNQNVN